MKKKSLFTLAIAGFVLLLLSTATTGEMVGIATSKETLSKTYAGKVYSPYALRSFPTFPLWGDQHLHTAISVDVGTMCRLGQEDAYVDSCNRLFYPQ